jgi:excisionase family DNA binding protein
MSACRKLSFPVEAPSGPLVKLYQGYLEQTGSEVAAAIFAIDAYRQEKPSIPASPEEAEFLTVKQAARKYNLGERTVYRMIEDGLPVTRVGRALRIKPRDLARRLEYLGTRLR